MGNRAHRWSMTGAVIVCLVSTQWNGVLVASEEPRPSREASSSQSPNSAASETQPSTSVELAPASSMDEHAAETLGLLIVPLPQMERARLTLDAERLAANPSLWPDAQAAHRLFKFAPTQSVFAGQIYQGRPYRMNRDGSVAALMIGAVAAITGAAVLVYANRPECATRQYASGCGYGTKVIGGAVLSGGIVSLSVGALIW